MAKAWLRTQSHHPLHRSCISCCWQISWCPTADAQWVIGTVFSLQVMLGREDVVFHGKRNQCKIGRMQETKQYYDEYSSEPLFSGIFSHSDEVQRSMSVELLKTF